MLQLYTRCRDSVDEFKSISREVKGLHVVLNAIRRHWEENDLTEENISNLRFYTECCSDTLKELEFVLDKHKSLGVERKRQYDRLRWAAKKIAPIRGSLMNNAVLLSIFNTTISYFILNICPFRDFECLTVVAVLQLHQKSLNL